MRRPTHLSPHPPPLGCRLFASLHLRLALYVAVRGELTPPPTSPPVCRLFASLHLLALYVAMCGQLPGLEALQRPDLEAWLRAIGLWDPGVLR